jgi:hypothetical protein
MNHMAGALSCLLGLGFGGFAVVGMARFAERGEVWHVMGFPAYGEGPFERVGIPTSVPLLAGFVGVCAAEVVVGTMLWTGRRGAGRLSVGLLPLELAYWIGFALPYGPVLGVARTVAVIASWRAQPGQMEGRS